MNLPPDAIILCGGEGARLGGIDKPLRLFAGQPLIEHVLARIRPQAAGLRISANRNTDAYGRYGAVQGDGAFAGCGPLAGIAAALAAGLDDAGSTHLLCVPGDAPLLPHDLVQRLEAARVAAGASIAYTFDGRGPQPLCCLLDRSLHGDLLAYLQAGGRTPREWFARHRAASADFSDAPSWAWSLNTREEWQHAEQAFSALRLDE